MRHIVFVRLDNFYVKAVQESNPILQGAPIVVVQNDLVLDASPETTKWSVHPSITRKLARQRCPGLICEDYNPDRYQKLYHHVWSVLSATTPQVEPTALHEGYLDLTGCFPRESSLADLMCRLQSILPLKLLWGGGQDKWIANLSVGVDSFIHPDTESAFLERLPVSRLKIPDSLRERLQRLGIRTIGALMKVPRAFLQSHLQMSSREVSDLFARDSSEVKCLYPPRRIQLKVNLDGSDAELAEAIYTIANQLSSELRASHQQSSSLAVRLVSRKIVSESTIKSSKPLFEAHIIATQLHRIVLESSLVDLREIVVTLDALSPHQQLQSELWSDGLRNEKRTSKANESCQVLERKYGHGILQNATDYGQKIRPRFAQMVYARRGIYLP